MIKSYEDLLVWQRTIKLSLDVYGVTKHYPKDELYGLISQLRRSAISIPSNIAEGRSRGTKKDFCQFLRIALGSLSELDTQLLISKELRFIEANEYAKITKETDEIGKMLSTMIKKLAANS